MVTFGIASITILILLYLFAKTEMVRREMLQTRRQLLNASTQTETLKKAVQLLAREQQMVLRTRCNDLKKRHNMEEHSYIYLEALIDELIHVALDTALLKRNAKDAFRRQLIRKQNISFSEFNDFISLQDGKIKTEWQKKTLSGYVSVCNLIMNELSNHTINDIMNEIGTD